MASTKQLVNCCVECECDVLRFRNNKWLCNNCGHESENLKTITYINGQKQVPVKKKKEKKVVEYGLIAHYSMMDNIEQWIRRNR